MPYLPGARCILLVDDDVHGRDALARLLREEDYRVVAVGNCEAALRSIGFVGDISLVITELSLADGDGCWLRDRLCEHRAVASILLTAEAIGVHPAWFRAAGFDHCFLKPVHFADLLEVVDDLLWGDPPARAREPKASRMCGCTGLLREMCGPPSQVN